MNKARNVIKKLVYKVMGPESYQKAYAKGKIKDINNSNMIEPEIDFLHYFIKENSTVLDIGANYGHYAYLMAKLNPKGKVYAYEPVPFTFGVLEKVKSHFNLNNIEAINAAVSASNGMITINLPLLDFGAPNTGVAFIGNSENEKMESFPVKTISLDQEVISGSIDFIKIDVEGHEKSAFDGMKNLILKHRPVVLIEFSHPCMQRAGVDVADFSRELKNEFDYSFFRVNGNKLKENNQDVPGDGYYFLIPSNDTDQFNMIISS